MERAEEAPDPYQVYRMLLLPLENVRQSPVHHPEGDVLYHSLQVFELAKDQRPYDEEFLLAALLHDVGKGIDRSDHVAAGLSALEGLITERTRFLIEHHMDAHAYRAGTLGHRLRRETTETVATLLRDRESIGRYADARAYTSQAPSRLEVIAGDDRFEIADAIGAGAVGHAVGVLERHYNLVCLDTAAGVLGSAARGVLDAADQLVIVSSTSLDGARAASSTLDWLEDHGLQCLALSAVAVLNGIRANGAAVDLGRIEEHFASRCQACVRIPWDPHLETGAEVVVDELRPETRQAFLELAAAIACGFIEPTERRS
jgi:MinD-like ATPase involved in chromosome partitioning or flagellar assembly